MRAVVLDGPGPPGALVIQDIRFDQIVEAHADMEANRVSGKLVVLT